MCVCTTFDNKHRIMDKDFINELKKQEDVVLSELKSYENLEKKLALARQRLNHIQSLLIIYSANGNNQSAKRDLGSNYTPKYDPNLIWEKKCLFVLAELGTAYASDIANKILEHEPSMKPDRAREAASFYLSKLLKSGQIAKVGQVGKKYRFGLNKSPLLTQEA